VPMSIEITGFLDERIAAGDFPSAVFLAAESGDVVVHGAVGNAVVEPELIAARPSTIYDLASLTKPLVTTLLIAMFLERGEVDLGTRVADRLPEIADHAKRQITVCELLTHTSRLPAWCPLYLLTGDNRCVLDEINKTPLDHAREPVTYSDLGFIILGRLIERISGVSFADAAWEYILSPLGLIDTGFNPPDVLRPRIAASEKGNVYEAQACVDEGYSLEGRDIGPLARTDVIWGEVHDGNAFFMGGAAGHAGLFSTATETLRMAEQFLPRSTELLKPETCDLFKTNFTAGMNEDRSLGFQLASTPESATGAKLSPMSFGHLGFTGTSLWIDPVAERVFILFTNRTHGRRPPFVNINSVRRRFADMAADEIERNK
jgi:CubicO group peptidase (beta-lactamase class C family)